MRSWRWLLPAVAITALSAVAACDTPVGPGAPVSQPSEVTGRVWFCTPSQVQGEPGEDKASDSAVTLEIVTAASSGASDSKRFPPNTVLGRATANGDERWPPGSGMSCSSRGCTQESTGPISRTSRCGYGSFDASGGPGHP